MVRRGWRPETKRATKRMDYGVWAPRGTQISEVVWVVRTPNAVPILQLLSGQRRHRARNATLAESRKDGCHPDGQQFLFNNFGRMCRNKSSRDIWRGSLVLYYDHPPFAVLERLFFLITSHHWQSWSIDCLSILRRGRRKMRRRTLTITTNTIVYSGWREYRGSNGPGVTTTWWT